MVGTLGTALITIYHIEEPKKEEQFAFTPKFLAKFFTSYERKMFSFWW